MSEATIPTLFGRATEVLGQHADLLKTTRRLRNLCITLGDSSPTSEADVGRLLDEFLVQLASHFATEEAHGYFGTLIADSPQLLSHVSRLLEEHEEMTNRLRDVRQLADVGNARELVSSLEVLLDKFERHERAENALLQKYFAYDEGNPCQ